MGYLYLIRHGQPILGLDSYDNLCEHGRIQSERLGEFLCTRGIHFDYAYAGTLKRQQDTARIIARLYREQDRTFPEILIHPGFDEIDFVAVIGGIASRMQEDDQEFRALFPHVVQAFQKPWSERIKLFERFYLKIFNAWVMNLYQDHGWISWEEYRLKVLATMEDMRKHGKLERIAIFTSGTPIGLYVQQALGLSLEKMMEVVAFLYHTNVTTFLLQKRSLILESLNVTAHLLETERTKR